MTESTILENAESEIVDRNRKVVVALSLLPNPPDERGNDKIDLAREKLERDRTSWENTETEFKLGEQVLIPTETPIRIAPQGAYLTGEPFEAELYSTHSLRGGAGFMERGRLVKDPLFKLIKPHKSGQQPIPGIIILVPNNALEPVTMPSETVLSS